MGGRPSINILSRCARLAVYSLTSELKKIAITVIRRGIAEFLTKIERKRCNNTQDISMDVIYFLRSIYRKRNDLFIS